MRRSQDQWSQIHSGQTVDKVLNTSYKLYIQLTYQYELRTMNYHQYQQMNGNLVEGQVMMKHPEGTTGRLGEEMYQEAVLEKEKIAKENALLHGEIQRLCAQQQAQRQLPRLGSKSTRHHRRQRGEQVFVMLPLPPVPPFPEFEDAHAGGGWGELWKPVLEGQDSNTQANVLTALAPMEFHEKLAVMEVLGAMPMSLKTSLLLYGNDMSLWDRIAICSMDGPKVMDDQALLDYLSWIGCHIMTDQPLTMFEVIVLAFRIIFEDLFAVIGLALQDKLEVIGRASQDVNINNYDLRDGDQFGSQRADYGQREDGPGRDQRRRSRSPQEALRSTNPTMPKLPAPSRLAGKDAIAPGVGYNDGGKGRSEGVGHHCDERRPTDAAVERYLKLIMAEMDYISHSVGTHATRSRFCRAALRLQARAKLVIVVAKYWGTSTGCKHGPQCRFTHDPLPRMVWNRVIKPDWPALNANGQPPAKTGGSQPGGAGHAGQNQSHGGNGSGKRGGKGQQKGTTSPPSTPSRDGTGGNGQEGDGSNPGKRRQNVTISFNPNLLTEVSTLIKTIKTESNKDITQLKVISLKRLEHDPDGAVLLDSGATHCLRQPRSEKEWESAMDTQVQTATGSSWVKQTASGTTLLAQA
eukprot:s1246_g26.t1